MASDDPLPSVLLVTCSDDICIGKLIKLIVGETETSNATVGSQPIVWEITTKYYDASVELTSTSIQEIGNLSPENLNRVGGMIVYFNGEFESIEHNLKSVEEVFKESSGVKILVTDECTTDESRLSAEKWCVSENFELVELTGPEGDNTRLKQALEAHVWPNLAYKMSPGSSSTSKIDKSEKAPQKTNKEQPKEDVLDDFSTLFAQLATMKEQAAGLPSEERKNFAEQVVLAYWRSIGGDEDQLLDM